MMKKVTLLMLLCCAYILPAFAQFSYVPVTGYNADIVAEGAAGLASLTTNAAADVAVPPYVFVTQTFNPGSGICASGATALPPTNTITSANATNNTGITYTLQPYGTGTGTSNNVLQMLYNASGTFTLTTPISAAKLYIVCLGGSGAVNFTALVNFTDATSQSITNSPAAPDWCGGAAQYKLTTQQYFRIPVNAATCGGGGACQYLYEIPITIDPANFSKTIASVTFTNNSTGTVFSIFAMGAQAPCVAPAVQATALVLTPASTSQIGGSFTAAAGSPTGYVVVRYPQGSVTTNPGNGTTYTVGQSLGLGTVVSVGSGTTFSDAGLNGGTNYSYYVYAYNAGTNCGGPVYNLVAPLTATQSTNSCGTMSGTIPVGPGLLNTPASGFTSLTNAMTYINANGLGGNTTLELQSGYIGTSANETFPITFPSNPCVSITRTLTIQPAANAVGLSISNLSDGAPVIDFNGASYVTINGLNNLTITNTSVASTANTSTIRFINDAKNNAIVNCSVLGSSTGGLGTNNGTIYFATGTVTGNDNNSISGCKIGANGTSLPSKGIYALGSTTNAAIANSGIAITNNEIFDYFLTGGCAGIYALNGNTDWTIASNKVYQTSTRTFTGAGTLYGIYFSSTGFGQNIQITANTIGYASGTATGTMTLNGAVAGLFTGIYFNSWTSGTLANNLSGNIISDISFTSTSSASAGSLIGILNAIGSAGTVTVNIDGNQIKNITALTTTGAVYGISWGYAATMSMSGNTVNNMTRNTAGTMYAMYSNGGTLTETFNNNIVSNITSTATSASTLAGIYQNTASGTKVIQNNQVFNLTGAAGSTLYGIRIGFGTTIDISRNTIYNLNSSGGTSGAVYGISTGGSGTTFNVYRNKVYGLSMSSTGGIVYGLYNTGSASNIYNNLVGDLASTTFTSTTSPYLGLAGIYINSGNSNIYNNTVRIGSVTSSGANFSTTGIYANVSPTVLLQNNLIVNLATATGSGKTVAHMRSGTALTNYAAASNTNAFYAGTPGAANVIFWDGTNVYQDLAAYKTAMVSRDQYSLSVNPTFISTIPADATYLHIPAGGPNVLESAGTNVALFNTDFDGQTRPGPTGSIYGGAIYFDIGADEFDAVPAFSCIQPAPGNTVATPATICVGGSTILSLQNATPGNAVLYKWFSSTDGTTYVEIAGATNPTYTATPTVPTYYKATVTCGGTLTATSNPLLVTFTNLITGTTPVQRCGTGSVSLGATASSGTIRWYAAATNGVPLASGSPFVTPSISATTTYYVGAESPITGAAVLGTGTSSTGTTSYPNPLSAYYGGTKHQLLFLASELISQGLAPGNITSISFDLAAINTAGICNDFTIRLGHTSVTALSGFETGTVTAYNASYTPSTTGIVTFNLTAPFNWNGTSNLILETVHNQGNGGNGSGTTHRYTTTPFNSVYVRYADNITPAGVASFDATTGGSTTSSSNRPNVIFGGQVQCSSPRIAVTATVNTAPTFAITADQTVCNGAITPLTVTSTLANYNVYNWTPVTNLYTDAAATIPYVAGANASTVYLKSSTAAATTYTVNASNTTTQCAAVTTTTQTVLPGAVTATATPGSICVSGTTTFSLTPATGYGASSFQWQSSANNTLFADVNGATLPTYTTPVTTTTTYYRATIKNSAGASCLNSVSDTARVYNPIITATTPGSRCGPGTVTLGATASQGTINWYAASTGGASLGTGTSFTTPSISGTTTYYASAAAGGGSGTATLGAGALTSVSGSPDFSGISPYAYHYGNYKHQMLITAAELTALGITAGDITSLAFDVANPGSPVAAFNNFSITLIPTSLTALTSTFETGGITVYSAASVTPVLGLNNYLFSSVFPWNGSSNVIVQTCYNNNNSGVVASSAEVKYDNTTFVSQNIYRADGSQPAVCAVTTGNASNDGPIISKRPKMVLGYNGACESPRVAVVATINPLPTPTITPAGPVNICAGQTTTLTGGGGGTYQWRNAAGNIGGATNSTYTTGTAGTYRVVVTTTATGCKDTSAPVTVNVNALPVVNLGNDTTFCSGNTLTLNAGNVGSTYLWNNASTNQTRTVNSTGTYWVRVTNGTGCQKTDTINVTVNPTPVVNLGNDTNLCLGVSLVLNSGNPGATRLWDNNTTAQTRTVTSSGTYYVRVTNSFNCTARDTIVTTFFASPVVNLGPDQDICAGNTVTLDAGNPGETYLWDNSTTQQTRSVGATGTYFVTVKNIANCKGSDTVKVTFHPLPVVNLGNDTTFCYGNILKLDAGNPGASYLWNTNSTTQTIDVNTTGTYSVVVTDSWNCVGTDAINIIVKDPPSGVINAVHGNPATYTFNVLNATYVTGYIWNFGDGSPTVTGAMVQHTYANNGIYTVTVKLLGECADTIGNARTVDVYDANGTGIIQIDNAKELVLYPNPATDVVVIENKKDYRMKQVTLYSVVGQMLSTSAADSPDKHKVNTTGLASGIYTLRIETDKGTVIRKFEIMK
jgi:hypothetical protein